MTPPGPRPAWVRAVPGQEAADTVAAAFTEAFGGSPDGVWAAPGRVNLIGEHLDYNGGPVLPLALPHRTVAAVRRREDDVLRLVTASDLGEDAASWQGRLADVGPGAPAGWAAYAAGVLWALGEAGHEVGGLDVAVGSAVPVGSGLSSSAALECSVALAVADLTGLATDDAGRAHLVRACVRAENEVAGASTGGMDQAASLRCTAGNVLLLNTSDGSVEQVPLALAAAALELLVIDTRAAHRHADGQYNARRETCERAAHLLGVTALAQITDLDGALARLRGHDEADTAVLRRRVRHVVTETARVHEVVALLRPAGDGAGTGARSDAAERVRAVGPVLDASHASMRDDSEISSPELDTAVGAARAAGALGARMTGGGFGGSAVALVPVGTGERVATAVRAAALEAGHPEPEFLVADASAGAQRVR